MKKGASRNGTNLSDGFERLSGLDQSRRNDRSVALSIGVSEGSRRAWLQWEKRGHVVMFIINSNCAHPRHLTGTAIDL